MVDAMIVCASTKTTFRWRKMNLGGEIVRVRNFKIPLLFSARPILAQGTSAFR